MLELTDGSTWSLTRVYFSDVVGSTEGGGQQLEAKAGYVFLCLDFERVAQGSSIFFSIGGEDEDGDIYVIDNQGDEYSFVHVESTSDEACIAFVVLEDSSGFTLHFLDAEPIALGE